MRVATVVLGVIGVLLAAPGAGCSSAPEQDAAMLEATTWVATEMRAADGELAPVTDGVRTTIRFSGEQIAGNGGVNQYGGAYEASSDGSLTIEPGASTLMAGPEPAMQQEARFFALLPEVRSFAVTATALELSDAAGVVLVVFSAVEPTPLAGTTWICSAVNNGEGGVVTTVADSRITAVFDVAGKVGGSAGVNTYSGTYKTGDDGVIKVGPMATTRMAGPAALMEQEQQYLAALETATRYIIEDESLTLYGGDGGQARVLTYAAE